MEHDTELLVKLESQEDRLAVEEVLRNLTGVTVMKVKNNRLRDFRLTFHSSQLDEVKKAIKKVAKLNSTEVLYLEPLT